MDKLSNNEIVNSAKEVIKNRLNSTAYGTFAIFWFIFHWKFVYTLLFIEESNVLKQTGFLKSDYLSSIFFDYSNFNFWANWILPFLFTYIAIWMLPKYILLPAFEKEQEYEFEKKKLEIQKQRKLESEETKLEQETTKKVVAVVKQKTEEKKLQKIDPTVSWQEEFNNFKTKSFFHKFRSVIKAIYENNGYMSGSVEYEIPTNVLVYLDTNEIINRIGPNQIELAPKGKFFANKFSEANYPL